MRRPGIWFLCLLILSAAFPFGSVRADYLSKGVLVITNDTPELVALTGEWEIIPNQFIAPTESVLKPQFIQVPGAWQKRRPDLFPVAQGFGTYRLRIEFDAIPPEPYALFLPQISAAYRLYADQQLLAHAGTVAEKASEETPDYRRQIVLLPGQKSLTLTFHISNFHEAVVGGLWHSPELGRLGGIVAQRNLMRNHDLILFGAAMIFALYHFTLFALRRSDRSALAFALFCLIIALRTIITGERIFTEYFHVGWANEIRLEYASVYLAVPAFAWFLHSVYPQEFGRRIVWFFTLAILPFLLQLILPPVIFGHYLIYVQLIILAAAAWVVIAIVRILYHRRESALIFAIGSLLLVLTTIHDIITNHRFGGFYLVPLGLLGFLLAQSAILAARFARAFRRESEALSRVQNTLTSVNRFVPTDALKLLGKDSVTALDAGEQRELPLAVLFADIRNFTALSEQMTPQETFNFLNAYLNRMGPVIREHGGFIDKYLGDGIMALFPRAADGALSAARQIFENLYEYNALRLSAGYSPIAVGVGISYGPVTIGSLGETERLDITAVSDTVNLAARLQEMSRRLAVPVIVSELLFQQLTQVNDDEYRLLGQVRVKGKQQLVTIFEFFYGRDTETRDALSLSKGIFERAVHAYWNQDYPRAQELFSRCLELFPGDKVAELYLARCTILAKGQMPTSLAQDEEYLLV